MKTIVVANQKGGSGKSTLTVDLAAAAEYEGDGPALLHDADPQGTAGDWFNQRKLAKMDTPRYAPLDFSELEDNIARLEAAGAAYLFIDTAPSVSPVNQKLFSIADEILVPLNPTPADLRALVKGLPVIRASNRPFNFVLTRVRANLRNNEATALALESLGLVISTRIHERLIYSDTFSHGKTVFEINPSDVAAEEILDVWTAVKLKLEENKNSLKEERKKSQRQ